MNAKTSKKLVAETPVFTVVPPVAAPRQPRTPRPKTALGVVEQVREAMKPKNRLATCLGFFLGGFVPLATFIVAHHEINRDLPLYVQLGAYLVLGGLAYSAKTVYEWGKRAFVSPAKAMGFVLLMEGVMTTASTPWLAYAALAYLVCINGIATGCTLAVRSEK